MAISLVHIGISPHKTALIGAAADARRQSALCQSFPSPGAAS